MPARDWHRLRRAVEEVIDRPEEERTAVLDGVCAGDPGLRRDAEALLAADAAADGFLEPPHRPAPGRALAPGDRLGDLRLERRASDGGTAEIWRVRSARRPGPLALKIARADLPAGDLELRFAEEVRVLRRLSRTGGPRSGVVGFRGAGRHRDRPYLVLDWIEGEPLDACCDRLHLGVEERLRRVLGLAETVAGLHRERIVHRDLKPDNVLTTPDGRTTLLDFGLARRLGPRSDAVLGRPTRPLARLITPGYAPPEQVWGGPVTPALDVFALGAILHRLLLGRMPPGPWWHPPEDLDDRFGPGTGRSSLPSRIAAGLPPEATDRLGHTPRTLARRLRGDLDRVLRRALSPLPERRHRDASDLAADLRRCLADRPAGTGRGLTSAASRALATLLGR